MQWCFTVVLIYIYPSIFYMLIGHFMKCLFKLFACLKHWIVFLLNKIFLKSGYKSFVRHMCGEQFSPFCGLPFILFQQCLLKSIFNFDEVQHIFFQVHTFCFLSKKSLFFPRSKIFSSKMFSLEVLQFQLLLLDQHTPLPTNICWHCSDSPFHF